MDHTQLRRFAAAARHLHFAHAARELGIPRATLTEVTTALVSQLVGPGLRADGVIASTPVYAVGPSGLFDPGINFDGDLMRLAAGGTPKPTLRSV